MVSDAVHIDKPTTSICNEKEKDGEEDEEEEEEEEDNCSVATVSTEGEDGAVVLRDVEDKAPCFQNIEVTNSSDVHFGNKTYYQGPVTIKQILYTNNGERADGNDSPPQLAISDKGAIPIDCDTDYRSDGVQRSNGLVKQQNGAANVDTIGDKWISWFKRKHVLITAIVMLLVLAITVTLILVFTVGQQISNSPIFSDPDELVTDPSGLSIILRKGWRARNYTDVQENLVIPVEYVIIHHTATATCDTTFECIEQVRSIQNFHMDSNGWDDIGYNFLIGGDGNSYEGRGWPYVGAHAKGYNRNSIGIAFIGNYMTDHPTKQQLEQAQLLIKKGVKLKYIKEEYKLVGMNQVSTFLSPGTNIINEIKKWPHWSAKP